MANEAWLENLKVGDEVAVYHSAGFYGRHEIVAVRGETPKYFQVGGYRYRKADGHQAGDYWASCLVELTPELRAELADAARRRVLTNKIESVRWRDISTTTLEAVCAALEAEPKQEKP